MKLSRHLIGVRNWTLRHPRLRSTGIGVLSIAAAVAVKLLVKDWGAEAPSYVLFGAAIALAAWFGGWPAGLVATLTSDLLLPLVTRPLATVGSIVGGSTSLLFTAEALFFVGVVSRIQRERAEAAAKLRDADGEIARLRQREHDLQLIEQAFETVAVTLREHACLLLDVHGRITRWNAGAERLFGCQEARVLGEAWPTLGAPENEADDELRQLLNTPEGGSPTVAVRWMRRAEGERFQGEITVTPLRDTAWVAQGFAVVVRDLTTMYASEEFRVRAIAAQEALQVEADALSDQLEAIQIVLDPELSELPASTLVKELMGRLLTALPADGAAFVDTRPEANAVVFNSPRGLQAQAKRGRRPAPRGLRIIQNDAARAREGSAVAWPETVGLLVTVPVSSQKLPMGALEVVTRKARRWTERDALVLLLAADRVAAVLSGSTARESSEPTTTIEQIRLSLPQ